MPTERRKHERIDVDLPAMLVASGERVNARIVDLSRGGLCVKMDSEAGVQGDAELYLEFSDEDAAEGKAKIQWMRGRGIGLQFTEIDARFQRFLDDLYGIRPVLRTGLVKRIRRALITFTR